MSKVPKNIAASVKEKLLNRAKADNRPFNELLQYYAMERFLYRLSKSKYVKDFILKGALMLRVWESPEFRATMDIDLLGKIKNDEDLHKNVFVEIMGVEVDDDGLIFLPDTIQSERITEDADYEGIRLRFQGTLGSAKIFMQIDIGFGDIIFPGPRQSTLPTMLESPALVLQAYTRESSIAEKLEAMVSLGIANSRMKDFYDIWLLSRQFDFDIATLTEAIRLTFERRGTAFPETVEAFSASFIDTKKSQWAAFHKRLNQSHVPESFEQIVKQVELFSAPIMRSLSIA
jgi:predicted nucleotidyltransferase component of viral defense system